MIIMPPKNIKFGIIGKSLPYTLSPQIHSMFMQKRETFDYDIVEVDSIAQLNRDDLFQYNGLNVTVPYKQQIIKLLDCLKGDALKLNTVNTIVKRYGELVGYNTDTYGFKQLLKYNKINPYDKICVVLGSGGASQAIQYVLKQMNAAKVIVVSRNGLKSDNTCNYDDLKGIKGYLLVNTTPVGTSPNINESPVDEDIVKNFEAIVDIIYNPSQTKLLSFGIDHKKIVANGLYMLVSQAIKSQEYWQEIKYNKITVDTIYSRIKKQFNYKNQNNIYLTGMMSCGKSTVGKMLANELGYDFIDLDKAIEEYTKMSITEIFKKGESYFRDIESKVLINTTKLNKTIVATGGGIIKRMSNIYAMRVTGLCLWIDRNINLIQQDCDTSSRPLLNGKNQYISTIYNERKLIYRYAQDIRIENNGSAKDCVNRIIQILKKGEK